MSKDDVIVFEGVVEQVLPNTKFMVRLTNGHVIRAHISGRIRMGYIQILEGDRVTVEMSPYDLTQGRITWRHKNQSYKRKFKEKKMKVRPSVKPICDKCKIIKRNGKVMCICPNRKHKQVQG